MSTDVSALGLSVDPSGFDDTIEKLRRFRKGTDEAGDGAERLDKRTRGGKGGLKELGQEANRTGGMLEALARRAGTLVGSLAAVVSINAIGQTADQWSDLQSRVGAAVKDMSAAPALMNNLKDMANATYSSLDQTVEAFAGNIGAFKDMGMGASEAMKYTEALNHALVITATKGDRAASVQMHLAKAMDIGKLSGEGLDAVLANGGRVAQALAGELGTTVGGLRKFASEGKITSSVIANSLVGSLEDLRKEAAEMPATMADGMQRIATNFTAMIGQLDQATGSSATAAQALLFVGDNLEYVAGGLIGAAAGAAVYFIPSMISAVASLAATTLGAISLTTALTALKYALIGIGIGAVVVLVGAAATAMIKLTQATGSVGEAWNLVSAVASEVWRRIELTADSAIAKVLGGLTDLASSTWGVCDDIAQGFRTVFNYIVATGVATYDGLMAAWGALPEGFGALGKMAGAALVDALVATLKFATAPVDAILKTINAGAAAAGVGWQLPTLGGAFDGMGETLKNGMGLSGGVTAQDVAGKALAAAQSAMGKDYLGTGQTAFGDKADAASGRADAYREAARMLDTAASAPMTAWEKLKAVVSGTSAAVTEAGENAAGAGNAINDAGKKGAGGMDEAAKAAKKAADEAKKAKEALKKTADEGAQSLGEMFWAATEGAGNFKQAMGNVIMEIAKMQMMSGFKSLFGGGGPLSGIGSLFGGLLKPNALGNVYQSAGLSAHSGTVVSTPTIFPFAKGAGLMGEAGPEAILPLKRGPDGKLGVSSGGKGEGAEPSVVKILLGDGLVGQLLERSGSQTIQLIHANNKTIPSMMEKNKNNPRRT